MSAAWRTRKTILPTQPSQNTLVAKSDAVAYLTIDSQPKPVQGRPTPPARQVFRGWMYAASPGLNPVEHPVYDAWLITCRAASPVRGG